MCENPLLLSGDNNGFCKIGSGRSSTSIWNCATVQLTKARYLSIEPLIQIQYIYEATSSHYNASCDMYDGLADQIKYLRMQFGSLARFQNQDRDQFTTASR